MKQNEASPPPRKKRRRTTKKKMMRKGNGKNRRTPYQLERQEKIFMRSLEGVTIRALAKEFGCAQNTVLADIRAEEKRRSEELSTRRESEKARSLATYQDIYRRAIAKSDTCDKIIESTIQKVNLVGAVTDELRDAGDRPPKQDYQQAVRVMDHALDTAIKARERMDKLLGLDAPVKTDIGVDALLEALGKPIEKPHDLSGQVSPDRGEDQ